MFVGPNDLAASLRDETGKAPSKELMEQTLTRIREACARNKVASGLHVQTVEQAKRRIDEGWQFIAVASELKFMLQGASEVARQIHPELGAGELAKY